MFQLSGLVDDEQPLCPDTNYVGRIRGWDFCGLF